MTDEPQLSDTLYRALADRLAAGMASGAFRPGDRLPSVRVLAARENVSVSTAIAAYRELEDRGLIVVRPKSGFFVAAAWRALPEPRMHGTRPPLPSDVGVNGVIMEILEASRDPTVVPLAAASPGPEHMYPAAQVRRELGARLMREPTLATTYRMGAGYEPLRRAIARHAFTYGCLIEPDELVVTNGCMEALTLALRAITRAGQTIAIESPTYFSVLQIVESLGVKVLELPTNPRHGVAFDTLEVVTRTPGAIAAIVLMPNFSNPLGGRMPDEAKRRVVELMHQRGIPIVEDDVYGDLHFGDRRPKPMKSWDRHGNVVLCSSFSKTMAPGLRVGWMAPGRFRRDIALLKFTTSVTTSELAQAAVAELLASGSYERHLRKLRAAFARQVARATAVIGESFPQGSRVTRPEGGFVLWVELPERVDAMALFHRALAEGVSIAPGAMFSASGMYPHHIRISCGHTHTAAVDVALRTVGAIAAELASRPAQ